MASLTGEAIGAIKSGLRNSAKKVLKEDKVLNNAIDNLIAKGEINELDKLNLFDEVKRIAGEYLERKSVLYIVPNLKNAAEVKLFNDLRNLFFNTYKPLLKGEIKSTYKLLRAWRSLDIISPISKSDMEDLLSLRSRIRGVDSFNNAATMLATVKVNGKSYKIPYTSISGLDETAKNAKFINTKEFAESLGLTRRETNDLFRVVNNPTDITVRINDTEHKMLLNFSEDIDKLKVVHGAENIEVVGFEIKSLYAPCHSCKRQIIIYSDMMNIPKEKIKIQAVKISKTKYAENSRDFDNYLKTK